jgi:hypothetical protein
MSRAEPGSSFATKALHFYRTLDADGNAVQRSEWVTSHDSGLGSARLLYRAVFVNLHECVKLRIEFPDSFEVMFDDFDWRDLFLANEFGDGYGGEIVKFRHCARTRKKNESSTRDEGETF